MRTGNTARARMHRRLLVGLVVFVAGAGIAACACNLICAAKLRREPVSPLPPLGRVGPEGQTLSLESRGRRLLVPIPLYPSSEVQGFTFVPTGRGDEVGLYLMLATTDAPEVVRDYYLERWQQYGLRVRGSASAKPAAGECDLVTRAIGGRVASVEVLRAGAGPSRSLTDPLRPARPGDDETKIIFFVPHVARRGDSH